MFIHLRVHSEYSIADGLVTIDGLIAATVEAGMPAVALTDQSNLFATIKFYQAAHAAGIKPIIGADVCIAHPARAAQPYRLTLLCQNMAGYRNLTRLISRSYLEGQEPGKPVLQPAWLAGHTDGLIALSGGMEGDIGQALLNQQGAQAEQYLQAWLALFPQRFYLEVQRVHKAQEEVYHQALLPLAQRYQIPVVATNNVRFIAEADFEAHEARVCIHESTVLSDRRRARHYTPQQYFRSPAEMAELFADMPAALTNSVEIARRCNLTLPLGKVSLPAFPVPSGYSAGQFLCTQAQQGLQQRLSEIPVDDPLRYQQRLQMELDVINNMGFAGYFLIVADFIQWAKQNDIPVGPGRGSGAGSLVAYSLGITDIDPLLYDLLFERFLNPERVSMPDFDIDFCVDGRDRVITYVAEKYGRDSVSQIITYGTMAAKAVVRDVGRVLGFSYGYIDKIAKLIPFELGMTLKKALAQEADLRERYEKEEEIRNLLDLAQKLEGLVRNAGKHAGGVVIAPTVLTDFAPLYCEASGEPPVTQFDKDDVEAVGLVKFDFLGLRTLTIIDGAMALINAQRTQQQLPPLILSRLPLDDAATYQLIKSCATVAVFQLESRGMKELIKRLQPDNFEEIIALVALFRPGPLQSGMVDDFINRKHGRAKVTYLDPTLETILKPTYGIIVYQEQVMQIAQVLAGFTLGSADLLRRAMGKKKSEVMAKQRAIFITGAAEKNIAKKTASEIFDLMEKFADYGFNKSHSAAYALLAYQTAWLKTHYPAQFMAAVLSSVMDKTDKVVNFIYEARQLQLKILPPDIHASAYAFTVTPQGEIRYGLGAIKGAGEAAIALLIREREQHGEFRDLFDFCQRLDTGKVNRRVIEAFIKAGIFDCWKVSRADWFANLDYILQTAGARHNARQGDLFGLEQTTASFTLPHSAIWPLAQCLQYEKETLGFYFSGHPLEIYQSELQQFIGQPLSALTSVAPDMSSVLIAGLVMNYRTMLTKRGGRMAFLLLEDTTGHIEVAVYSDLFDTYKSILQKDAILIIEGELSPDEFTGGYKIVARQIFTLAQWRTQRARALLLTLAQTQVSAALVQKLGDILQPYQSGACPVIIDYQHAQATARLQCGEHWRVAMQEALLQDLRGLLGEQQVRVCY